MFRLSWAWSATVSGWSLPFSPGYLEPLLSGPLQRFLAKTKRLVFTSQVCMVALPLARSTLRGQRPKTQEGIDSPGLHELVRAFQTLEGYEILVRPDPSCALACSPQSTGMMGSRSR